MYRVFYTQQESIETLVPADYINTVRLHTDSVWMTSNWLHYSLIRSEKYPIDLLQYTFINRIEKVEPMQSIPLQLVQVKCLDEGNKKDSTDPQTIHKHRQWQLDTLGYQYFKENKIDGKGIVIAIIDAGFTMANESNAFKDIFTSGRVLKTWDFIDNDSNVFDGSTHGTGVWSCIAGNMDGKPTGLATGASFILLRSEDQKTETMADEDRWIQAIEKAYEWGADIVNSSVGFTDVLHSRDQVNGQTLISKAADLAAQKGMLVVVSAGNEWVTVWKTLSIPADAEGVVTVGGIDKEGNHSYFSSVGPTADGRAKPDVVAPGTCVTVKGNDFVMSNGTSFAAPLVAGYLACMLELKGKKNFTKDSLKYYGGLYPYFDYMYGYGVPSHQPVECSSSYLKCAYFGVDKDKLRVEIPTYCLENTDFFSVLFIKIVGEDGEVKYYNRISIKEKKYINIPKGKYQKFGLKTYSNPEPNDKWITWWNNCYTEY